MRLNRINALALLLVPASLVVAGCGGRVSASGAGVTDSVIVNAAATHVETSSTTRFSATLPNGEPAQVEWSVSGGDPAAGPGSISKSGVYTPPSYLTEDAVTVSVSARLNRADANPATALPGTAELTITPGFLQPLTPGNAAVGPGASVTISGSMTEVGGTGGIRFALASGTSAVPREAVSGGAAGTLSAPHCRRGAVEGPDPAYTVCSVTYTAPASVPPSGSVFVVGSVANSSTLSWTRILLDSEGISSNPSAHQAHLAVPVQLGSSSGNNSDYDAVNGQLSDCCGGTLGALLQDAAGNQYVLGNNHVLARSDQSIPGETVIQPGLIDNGCTPYGVGPGTTPVATLTGYPSLSSPATNVDAAIARVAPGAVDPRGNILEFGSRQPDGTLSAAPLGLSSTGGRGEPASLGMMVAKSGRTTGLTCAAVSAIDVDVAVDYFTDCAETSHALTKTFTNQIAISGTSFSDAGDSGAIVVDSANAEPVGLFYAGGTDANGIENAIASPVSDVLAALDTQVPGPTGPTTYGLVGGADHPVSCLTYGGSRTSQPGPTAAAPSPTALGPSELERAQAALPLAQALLNPRTGVARVEIASGKDHPGEAALALYLDSGPNTATASLPATIGGVPTIIVAAESASQPRTSSQAAVLALKQRIAASLMKSAAAVFGVGVGQSLDNPNDAAIILFVDRHKAAGRLPDSIEGQRVRIILMDRLHVTRSHGTPVRSGGSCLTMRSPAPQEERGPEPGELFQDKIDLPE